MRQEDSIGVETPKKLDQPLLKDPRTGEYLYDNAPKNYRKFGVRRTVDWKLYPDRTVVVNHPDMTLCDNRISTSKYTWLTFVPLNLLEQFSKLANIYFLFIGCMQMIDLISTSGGKPVIFLPLAFIVAVSAIKDLFEDRKRHQEDALENNKTTMKCVDGQFLEVPWHSLRVGNIIKVRNEEFIPADLIILDTDNEKGECFTETKNLDGETNLKRKCVPKGLIGLFPTDKAFNEIDIRLYYEKPTPFLYKFQGSLTLTSSGARIPVDANNFLLRSSSLRSKYAIGVVVYSGHETKIMLNSVKARPKASKLERSMQKQIILVFLIQNTFCLFCALYATLWYYKYDQELNPYMLTINDWITNYPFVVFLARFGNWMLIFTNFVPISLIVTLELVKFFQAKIITADERMINAETNIPVGVHSSNLNEELGQVEYVFSDKTGTLTCNIMAFKYLNVTGTSYGDDREFDLSARPNVTNVDFKDTSFFKLLENKSDPIFIDIHENLMLLSLCHTIQIEEKDGKPSYSAASPDELAFVNFAKLVGYEYINTDANQNMVVRIEGKGEVQYKLKHVLEFNSTRKRMSVIVEDQEGKIILLTKGADNIMLARMSENNEKRIIDQINKELIRFSAVGLRTLILAKRIIEKDEYEAWNTEYAQASLELHNREEKMMDIQEKIEKNLTIIGATAIEDKLQDEVGETIHSLKHAGIKVWVLTGDKVETAINIAYSCRLLDDSLTRFKVDGVDYSEVNSQLVTVLKQAAQQEKYGFILTGDALIHAAEGDNAPLLFEICSKASVVVACRVSPKQKSQIVNLIRDNYPDKTTLAIGDGANDVNMITAAHVGIGIRGLEGQQAARSSDYAIGEFKILRRLTLFYGRECIRRNATLVIYNFFKNIILIIPAFWFAFMNGFSGQILYDSFIFQLYNIFYASLPIVIYALLDEEYEGTFLEANPEYYHAGIRNEYFNRTRFWKWFGSAFVQSFFVPIFAYLYINTSAINQSGHTAGFWTAGMLAFTSLTVVANSKIFIFSTSLSILAILIIVGSVFFYVFSFWFLNIIPMGGETYGAFELIFNSGNSYLAVFITLVCCSGFDYAFRNWKYIQKAQDMTDLTSQRKSSETISMTEISSIEMVPHRNMDS